MAAIRNPPLRSLPYYWLASEISTADKKSGKIRAGCAYYAETGDLLPPQATHWAYPGDLTWTRIDRTEPDPVAPAVPFLLDSSTTYPPAVHTTHALFASENLSFAWLVPDHTAPIELAHPEEPGALFYPVNLAFLAWVRGRCKRVAQRGKRLTPAQQRAVDRVWSYVCAMHNITDDDFSALPEPSDVPLK